MLERPETVRVFNALGIDACCGGMQTLATAAADVGVPLADLLATLAGAAA